MLEQGRIEDLLLTENAKQSICIETGSKLAYEPHVQVFRHFKNVGS